MVMDNSKSEIIFSFLIPRNAVASANFLTFLSVLKQTVGQSLVKYKAIIWQYMDNHFAIFGNS